jgi:hypothetical protein
MFGAVDPRRDASANLGEVPTMPRMWAGPRRVCYVERVERHGALHVV